MTSPILDEFTNLPVSKQRKWKLRQMKAGRCAQCGTTPLATTIHCAECAVKHRELSRKRTGAVKRYKSKTYNLKEKK